MGPLVSKVKEYQVETIVDTLCTNMLSDKEQLRDISSIGLKTVIGELPPASSGERVRQRHGEKDTEADTHRNTQKHRNRRTDTLTEMYTAQYSLLCVFRLATVA